MAAITDYLAAELPIVQRLEDLVAPVAPRPRILTAADFESLVSGAPVTPAVFVIYAGDSRVTAKGSGAVSQVTQTWQVPVAVRNVSRLVSGAGAREDAGPILRAVVAALAGWPPCAGLSALEQVPPGVRVRYLHGLAIYPLAFSTTFEMRS